MGHHDVVVRGRAGYPSGSRTVARDVTFKQCWLKSGRFDGSNRHFFHAYLTTKGPSVKFTDGPFVLFKTLSFDQDAAVAFFYVLVEDGLELFYDVVAFEGG